MNDTPDTAAAAGARVWQQIISIRRWIDKEIPIEDSLEALTTRVLHIGEQHGAACEALLASTTADGRKLAGELSTLLLTAGVALCTADREAQQAFVDSLAWDEHTGKETIGRLVLKLGQEHGTACQTLTGMTAYHSRHGATHTMDDLVASLCAVVRAGAAALHRVDSAAEVTFMATLELAYNRSIGVVRLAT